MDQRSSGSQKRARGDGPHNEGDWTCPQCGNVNFAFRTNCNLRKCNAPKPSYPQQRVGPGNPSLYEQIATSYYMGSGGAPAAQMPLGMTTSYGVPMGPPAAGIPYDYNPSINLAPTYGAMSLQNAYGLPGGVGGVGLGTGLGYGTGPGLEGTYLMNYGVNRAPMLSGPGSGLYMEDHGSRKRRGDTSEGDWTCPKCGNTNFAFRTVCNMRKCNTPKPTAQPLRGQGKSAAAGEGLPDGSWTCDQCGNVNYSFRTKCNRRNCGAPKPDAQQPSKITANDQEGQLSRMRNWFANIACDFFEAKRDLSSSDCHLLPLGVISKGMTQVSNFKPWTVNSNVLGCLKPFVLKLVCASYEFKFL